jgi:hypothetical protein
LFMCIMREKDEGIINTVWWMWQTLMKAPDRKVWVGDAHS